MLKVCEGNSSKKVTMGPLTLRMSRLEIKTRGHAQVVTLAMKEQGVKCEITL